VAVPRASHRDRLSFATGEGRPVSNRAISFNVFTEVRRQHLASLLLVDQNLQCLRPSSPPRAIKPRDISAKAPNNLSSLGERKYPFVTSQLSYLEYLKWLQKVVPDGEFRKLDGEDGDQLATLENDSRLSGLELLRKLSKAAAPKKKTHRVLPITTEEKERAERGLYGHGPSNEVLASRFNVDLTRSQIECLRPGEWLNDEVINFYFKLLQERSKKSDGPKVWFVNSFFWGKLSGNTHEYSFKEVRRWTTKSKVDIFALDYVLFPMNIGESHWALGAIDLEEKGFRYFDSMFSRPHKFCAIPSAIRS